MKGAAGYALEVAGDADFEKIVFSHATRGPSLIVKRAPFTGTLHWRVRAKGPEGESDWSESGTFELY